MRGIFCTMLMAVCFICNAQDDDMPDMRSKQDNLMKMREKDLQSDISTFTMAGIDIATGKLPLRSLSISDFDENFIKFDSANIHISITGAPFNPARHKLQYSDKYLIRIDTKPYFGSYSKVPKKYIKSFSVVIDNDTVAIPATAFFDLYEPTFSYNEKGVRKSQDGVYFSANGRFMYVYLLCNDGMGGYEVTWVFHDKKYIRRVVDFNVLKN